MATGLLDRKLAKRFTLMDTDGDGYLEQEDYELLARRLIEGFAEPPTSPKAAAVLDTYLRFWDQFIARMDGDRDGRVSLDEYVDGIQRAVGDHAGFERVYRPHVVAVAALADTDGDGRLDRAEFARLMRLIGLGDAEVAEAFAAIDADGDGELTVDELVAAVRDFYLDARSGPLGSNLYGRA